VDNFSLYFSGVCFESGDSPEQVEKKVRHKVTSLGKVLSVEATFPHADERGMGKENYVVSFEGETAVQAEAREKAENQGYDLLSHLGQITVAAFKKEEE
jgi:hypothetical protein